MSLSVRTEAELSAFTNSTITETPFTNSVLQQATDLMYICTGLTDDPEGDEVGLRILYNGELAMAEYLMIQAGNMEVVYSPFRSERIASYAYTISDTVLKASHGMPTGVMWFDLACGHFGTGCLPSGDSVFMFGQEFLVLERTDGTRYLADERLVQTVDVFYTTGHDASIVP